MYIHPDAYRNLLWLSKQDLRSVATIPSLGIGQVVWNAEKGLFEPNEAYKDMFTTFTGMKRWENQK